jgi:diaminopimelate decarboxylase
MEFTDNTYKIQGLDISEIARQFGTPLYVYDAEKIRFQVESMKKAFDGLDLKINFAVKALSNLSVLRLMKKLGTALDVVSIQEAELGLMAGFGPEEILYTPNSVSFDEIKAAVKMGLKINIDNISILEQFGHEFHDTVPICIRINPHIMAGGNANISTGHIDSKFGISIMQLRHAERVIKTNNMKITGLHMHTGSDILNAEAFLQAINILFDVARQFPHLEFIDFGSGFKVAYREDDVVTDITDLGNRLSAAFNSFCKDYGRKISVWFEPGKYLVSEAGLLLVRANVIKTTPATVFVGVNSGMNHLIRPMMYGAHHDIVNISNPAGTTRIYSVVGYICETDTLGSDRKMNEVREGDILAVKNAGAYGYSMSSNYNSRLRPAEVMVIGGEAKLIRKAETMDDLTRNMVEIDI